MVPVTKEFRNDYFSMSLRIIGRMKMRNEGEMKIIVYQMEMRFKF
jgi:hypothetical protein